MSDKNQTKLPNRRSVLRKTAGATAGLASFTGPVAAWTSEKTASTADIERIPEVQSIISELNLEIKEEEVAKVKTYEPGQFKLSMTTVSFESGKLRVGKLNKNTSAVFTFSDKDEDLPKEYQDIPSTSEASLFGREDRVVFRRTATDDEARQVRNAVELDPDVDTTIYTEGESDAFFVDAVELPEKFDDYSEFTRATDTNIENIEYTRYNVKPQDMTAKDMKSQEVNFTTAKVSTESLNPIDAAQDAIGNVSDAADDCGAEISGCVGAMAVSRVVCNICLPACIGGPTGFGAVVCVGCALGACSNFAAPILPGSCVGPGGALDCLDSNGYI